MSWGDEPDYVIKLNKRMDTLRDAVFIVQGQAESIKADVDFLKKEIRSAIKFFAGCAVVVVVIMIIQIMAH